MRCVHIIGVWTPFNKFKYTSKENNTFLRIILTNSVILKQDYSNFRIISTRDSHRTALWLVPPKAKAQVGREGGLWPKTTHLITSHAPSRTPRRAANHAAAMPESPTTQRTQNASSALVPRPRKKPPSAHLLHYTSRKRRAMLTSPSLCWPSSQPPLQRYPSSWVGTP